MIDSSHMYICDIVRFEYQLHFGLESFDVKGYVIYEPHLWASIHTPTSSKQQITNKVIKEVIKVV